MSTCETADVVVVGGGIFGLSTAFHLQEAGAGRVVLLEGERELAARTTAAAAGFISLWSMGAPSPEPELSIERYGLEFYAHLSARHDIGLRHRGLAHVATSQRGAEDQARGVERLAARLLAGEVELLDADRLRELVPILNRDAVYGAVLVPGSVSLDAGAAARALAEELAHGVEIRTGSPALELVISDGMVAGVETPSGTIATGRVVVTAGAALAAIARRCALELPLLAFEATRFVTEPLPDVSPDMPMLMFPSYHNLYLRPEDGGLLGGCEEIVIHPPTLLHDLDSRHDAMWSSAIKPDGRSPVAGSTHVYHLALARAFANVVPLLGTAAVHAVAAGTPVRTPDMRHVLGAAPGVRGLFLLGADLECGMTRGPGLGRLLSQLVLGGPPSWTVEMFRPDRWQRDGRAAALIGSV